MLRPGDTFPTLTLTPPDGEAVTLPDALGGDFGVVLIYRGDWCPFCRAQLAAFQAAQDQLAEVGARVFALSVQDEATTRALIEQHGLTFPVGCNADARAVAAATGAFVNEDPLHLQPTGFVLAPDGSVIVSVYSSSAIGRLVAEDTLGLIGYARAQAAAAAA